MKLFARYNVINLAANIGIFIFACVALYFSLRFVLIDQIDEDLEIEQGEIMAFVSKHASLPEEFPTSDQVVEFTPARGTIKTTRHTVKRIDPEHPGEHRLESFRELLFTVFVHDQYYRVAVFKSLEKTNSLLRSILMIATMTVLTILVASLLLNRFLIGQLWRPFYTALDALKNFRVSATQPLALPDTNIDEFNYLNGTLKTIATKSRVEYAALKTFSENASHEMQTPLAIIRSKLDLIIQDEQLNEQHAQAIGGVYDSIETLTRLNHGLLLLTRIDNQQFAATTTIDLNHLLNTKLQDFTELWQDRNIHVHVDLQPAFIAMNEQLADTLLNNLLSNATNHNRADGSINIELTAHQLSVTNSSESPALDPERMYDRFYRPSSSGSRNGLGLSIIRQIADVSGLKLEYHFSNGMHGFSIRF